MRRARMRARMRAMFTLAAPALLGACELSEIALTEPERAVIAEAYVRVNLRPGLGPQPGPDVSVLLHETLGKTGGSGPVPGAQIAIVRPSNGLRISLQETALNDCVITTPVSGGGTCYVARGNTSGLASLAPSDRLTLRIDLPDGEVMLSETVVPGSFDLLNMPASSVCFLDPLTPSGLIWSRSAGAWAYISDTFIRGLGPMFPAEKEIEDPLYLWGLSVSAQDTTIVFPTEFGLFNRGDLDHDLSVLLQKGLPAQSSASISVAAVDRNWVNWARGANFNPSGVIRVPSIRGDRTGTGVFASTTVRSFAVQPTPSGPTQPDQKCPPPPKAP